MNDFQLATDRFLAWFEASGGTFRDDLLEIRDLRSRDAGRGIIAIKDISQDTILFTIPRDLIINVQTSELQKKLPDVFDPPMPDGEDEEYEPLDSWASLILVMLYEYLQGEASKWKPYIDVLPQTFDTPIFWTEAELKELKGTCLTTEKIGKRESDEMLRSRILPIVLQNPGIFYPQGAEQLAEDNLLKLSHRMGSTIMAYAFDLEPDGEKEEDEEEGWVEDREGKTLMGMVPMADILNADAEFNAHVNHSDSLEVTSLRSNLIAGSEVLNYYGPLPSSELLRRYGYLTPEHERYDVAELPWSLVLDALSAELGMSHADLVKVQEKLEEEEELEEYFIIERDSGDPDEEGHIMQQAKLRDVSPELEEQVKVFLKALKKSRPDAVPEKRKHQDIYGSIAARALTAKLAQYPTSIEEDGALLREGEVEKRRRMAIEMRQGEKRLLQEALALVKGGDTGERAGKRAKREE